jgi:hypothetical protein
MPPYLQTAPIGGAGASVDGAPWELRAATVAPNGEPWIELDSEAMPIPDGEEQTVIDWPYPAPGPGMVTDDPSQEFVWPAREIKEAPSDALRPEHVPGASATWNEITWFAAQFDGYVRYGDRYLGDLANGSVAFWERHHLIEPRLSLDDLRGCLFFEYRRYHHFGHVPSSEQTPYLRALVEAIRQSVAAKPEA